MANEVGRFIRSLARSRRRRRSPRRLARRQGCAGLTSSSATTRSASPSSKSTARSPQRPRDWASPAGTCRSATMRASASPWWWLSDESRAMRRAHSVAAVRAAEQALMAKLPHGVLMQRAAAGLAATCASVLDRVYGARVVVLAGGGDNGGDALYAGARLAARGAHVTAIAASNQLHDAGAADLIARGGSVVPATDDADAAIGSTALAAINSADLIIDGLTGIGGHGGLREPAATLASDAEWARQGGALVVAVDLPSGIDANTGEVHGAAVQVDVTVTFGTHKPGLLVEPGASCAGTVELIDIGLAPFLPEPDLVAMQAADIAAILPLRTAESDKYRRGVLGILAGSDQYTGAA